MGGFMREDEIYTLATFLSFSKFAGIKPDALPDTQMMNQGKSYQIRPLAENSRLRDISQGACDWTPKLKAGLDPRDHMADTNKMNEVLAMPGTRMCIRRITSTLGEYNILYEVGNYDTACPGSSSSLEEDLQ